MSKILKQRLFVVLGEISFSMYLIHQIVIRVYMMHKPMFEPLPADAIFTFLVIATCLFSYGMWRFVELPGQAKLKNMFSKLGRKQGSRSSTALT
jgi:peptidoglycan/LPS O-acetylase OafA/YrhL